MEHFFDQREMLEDIPPKAKAAGWAFVSAEPRGGLSRITYQRFVDGEPVDSVVTERSSLYFGRLEAVRRILDKMEKAETE